VGGHFSTRHGAALLHVGALIVTSATWKR